MAFRYGTSRYSTGRRAGALLLSLALAACAQTQARPVEGDLTVKIGSPPVVLLGQVYPTPEGNGARQRRLLQLFDEVGCGRAERWREASELPQVVCTLPGASVSTVVVTANFDQPLSRRLDDNWSGAAMLPSLYLSLGVAPRHHTYTFIAFADEGRGQAGNPTAAVRMLERLPDEERRIAVALVSLKGMSLDVPAVWEPAADPQLHIDLYSVSRSLELPMRRIDFRRRVVRGRSYGPLGVPDTAGLEAPIRPPASDVPSILIALADREVGEYLDSFRLVSTYLSYLDQTLVMRKEMGEESAAERPEAPAEPPG